MYERRAIIIPPVKIKKQKLREVLGKSRVSGRVKIHTQAFCKFNTFPHNPTMLSSKSFRTFGLVPWFGWSYGPSEGLRKSFKGDCNREHRFYSSSHQHSLGCSLRARHCGSTRYTEVSKQELSALWIDSRLITTLAR